MNMPKITVTPPDMKEAMTLIQSGRLQEATAAIQRSLSGADSASSPTVNVIPHESVPVAGAEAITSFKDLMSKAGKMGKLGSLGNFKLEMPVGSGREQTTYTSDPLPENAQFFNKTFSHVQGTRDYKLYIPASYQQDMEKGLTLPLVIMLHGCTQSPEDFAAGTRMNTLAEEHHCLIAYPAQPATANQNRCWNWFRPADQQAGQGEPVLLAGITAAIIEDYAVDPQRVYIAGLSAGGAMAVIMAETYPEYYAAAGVHSGLAYRSARDLPSALMAMRQGSHSHSAGVSEAKADHFVPTIVFHGDQDQTVATCNGEQILEQAKRRLNATIPAIHSRRDQPHTTQGRSSTRTRLSDADGNVQLEHWLVHGAGHAWAGGSSNGSYTDPAGPDASAEMLRFFLSHQR